MVDYKASKDWEISTHLHATHTLLSHWQILALRYSEISNKCFCYFEKGVVIQFLCLVKTCVKREIERTRRGRIWSVE